MAKVTLENLGPTVDKILQEYEQDIHKGLSTTAAEVAKAGAAAVRAGSPRQTGAYARGWTSKTTTTRLSAVAVIYNRTEYPLAHLLENGHALKRGGRLIGNVSGIPHIKPVEEEINARFEKAVKAII